MILHLPSQVWLVIFPEGTRYNVKKPSVIQKSRQFSKENGKYCPMNFTLTYAREIFGTISYYSEIITRYYEMSLLYVL